MKNLLLLFPARLVFAADNEVARTPEKLVAKEGKENDDEARLQVLYHDKQGLEDQKGGLSEEMRAKQEEAAARLGEKIITARETDLRLKAAFSAIKRAAAEGKKVDIALPGTMDSFVSQLEGVSADFVAGRPGLSVSQESTAKEFISEYARDIRDVCAFLAVSDTYKGDKRQLSHYIARVTKAEHKLA